MNTKKMLLIGAGVFVVIMMTLGLFETTYNNSFTATRPEVVETENGKSITLNMVVDHSGSMRGYTDLTGLNAEKLNFVSNVCDLLTSFESKFKSNSTVYCGENTYNKVGDFSKELSNNNIFQGGATEIGDLITNCIEKQVSDTSICAVVSDMVLSYGLNVLRTKGRDYNKIQLEDGLGHTIYEAATIAKDKGYDIIIMKYTSDFNGKYYYDCTENNLNSHKPYQGKLMQDRPYYIMLIGKKECILAVYEKCIKECDALYTSFEFEEGDKAENITIEHENKAWLIGNDPSSMTSAIYTKNDLRNTQTEFFITYENFVLPKYIKSNSLTIKATENFTVKDKEYKNNTLSFTLVSPEFDKMNTKNEVVITVSYKRPTNWEHISIKNDVNQPLDSLKDKTWGVSKIFENIDKAYFEDEHPSENQVSTAIINFIKNN